MILISSSAIAANRTVVLEIQNMTCSMCPLTVKKALTKIHGVQDIEIDYENKIATIKFDEDIATVDKLIDATKNAGYPSTIRK